MVGAIIGGAMKLGAGIFGGAKQAQAYRKVMKNIKNQMKENQDWYDQRYNEDATERADAQALLTKTEESIRNRNRQSAGSAAVMGGTEESIAAAKAANNEALTDAVSNIAASADARKDKIESQYMSTKADLNKQLNDMETAKAKAISSAVSGGVNAAAGSIATAFPGKD